MTEEQKELNEKINDNAQKYVYNLMQFEGEYTPDKFEEIRKGIASKSREEISKLFKDMTDEEYSSNLAHLTTGYGLFGTEFINKLIDTDPESAKVLLETATQGYLDLQATIMQFQSDLQNNVAQVQKAQQMIDENKNESNS